MSLKKYVKENIYGLPAKFIDHAEISGFKNYMLAENPEYLDDILGSIDTSDLVRFIALNNYFSDGVTKEARNIKILINHKLKEEILMFIDQIRQQEQEEAEEIDNGISNNDRLMQEHR